MRLSSIQERLQERGTALRRPSGRLLQPAPARERSRPTPRALQKRTSYLVGTTYTRLQGRRRIVGKFAGRMDWWLPEERGPRSQANRPDSVGPALGIHPVESHLFSRVPAALPGLDELDSDTNGCTAPSAIACPGAIGAADDRHWVRSRLAGQRTSVRMSTAAAAYRRAGKGKSGPKVSFRSAPPRSPCMGSPWRPGQHATCQGSPSGLPVIGQCFNDISSFARVFTVARSYLCLVRAEPTPPK